MKLDKNQSVKSSYRKWKLIPSNTKCKVLMCKKCNVRTIHRLVNEMHLG